MWYPTLPDVLRIYERVATRQGHDTQIDDPAALDRVIVAPQREGSSPATKESLSKKAAALCVMAAQTGVFAPSTATTTHILVTTFLDRNGADLKVSADELAERTYPMAEGDLGMEITDWLKEHIEVRPAHLHRRRLLEALTWLARTIEDMEGVPGLERDVETLDRVGAAVAREVASLFPVEQGGREGLRKSFPAVEDQWGEPFE